jgi:hypothetical protein
MLANGLGDPVPDEKRDASNYSSSDITRHLESERNRTQVHNHDRYRGRSETEEAIKLGRPSAQEATEKLGKEIY